MAQFYVLFNPIAGNANEATVKSELSALLPQDELTFSDITKTDYDKLFSTLEEDCALLLAGGDGTLNKFINDTDGKRGNRAVYYYAAGNGNDFWNDLGFKRGDAPVRINEYIENLPVVTVNGMKKKFINGVGYGIDGYCCEVGDAMREKGEKANYTAIAIKGLLFHYKPKNATVTVDGKTYTFPRVWIAPTMFGRYYGGGMIPTPNQDRKSDKRTVSTCLMYGAGKIKTLMIFPSIFKGEHVKKEKNVQILSGHTITVKFDRPSPLQIDGETVLNVLEYTVEI